MYNPPGRLSRIRGASQVEQTPIVILKEVSNINSTRHQSRTLDDEDVLMPPLVVAYIYYRSLTRWIALQPPPLAGRVAEMI
jgi:hypothetical protein